jgi:hypothetical protein
MPWVRFHTLNTTSLDHFSGHGNPGFCKAKAHQGEFLWPRTKQVPLFVADSASGFSRVCCVDLRYSPWLVQFGMLGGIKHHGLHILSLSTAFNLFAWLAKYTHIHNFVIILVKISKNILN